ncbi:MAG: hypothetical protein QM644_18050 [Mobilitalea sp.]
MKFIQPLNSTIEGTSLSTYRRQLQKWKDLSFHRFTPTTGSLKKFINRSFYHHWN